jgi:hypothetical protein
MTINEFHIKFEVFQECVKEWLDELNNDLHALGESEGTPSDIKNVIRFPNNGKKRFPQTGPDRQG